MRSDREILFNKYNGKCAYCGCNLLKGWHQDHKEPIRRFDGGYMYKHLDNIDNKEPSCSSCNINKHSMSVEEFRSLIEGFIKSLNERSTQYKIAKRYGLIQETNKPVVFYFETFEL